MKKVVILGIREPSSIFLAIVVEILIKHAMEKDRIFMIEWEADTKYYSMMKKVSFLIKSYLFEKGISSIIKVFPVISKNNTKFFCSDKYFYNIHDLKNYRYKEFNVGFGVASSLISLTRDHGCNMEQYKSVIDSLIDTSVHTYETFKNYLEKIKPDLVYIFNGRFAETTAALQATQELKIDFITYEVGSNALSYSLFKNTTPHDFDYAQEEAKKLWIEGPPNKAAIAEKWYEDRRNGIEPFYNNPEFKLKFLTKQVKNILPVIDKNKINIGIFNSSIDEFASLENSEQELYLNQNVVFHDILENFKNDPSYHFYLRVHPNLAGRENKQIQEIRKLDSENYSNLTVIYPDEPVDSYALISECNLILTAGSTIGIESVMLGKPAISFVRTYFDRLDSVYLPSSEDELIQLLKSDLKPKSKTGALIYGYWASTFGYQFETFDFEIHFTEEKNKILIYNNKLFKMKIIEDLSDVSKKNINVLF